MERDFEFCPGFHREPMWRGYYRRNMISFPISCQCSDSMKGFSQLLGNSDNIELH